MRLALASVAGSALLFLAGAAGLVGSWALPVSAVILLCTAVSAAVAMEARDLSGVEGLVADDAVLEAA